MKWVQRIVIFLLVILPIIAAFWLPLAPEPIALLKADLEASLYEKSGDRKAEIAALQAVVSYQPWQVDKWERIGNLQYVTGNDQEAIDSFSKASTFGELSARSIFNEGNAWNSLGNADKARNLYREASEAGATEVDLYIELAKAQENINDSIGTLATLLRAYGLAQNDKGINYELGVQFAASQPEHAIPFLNTASQESLYSSDANALIQTIDDSSQMGESAARYIYIGQELSQVGEWQAAASAFSKATDLDASNGIAWALRGEAVQHVGEDGFNYLSKALTLDPHSDIVNGLTAVYFRRQQKYDVAIDYLYRAVEDKPNEGTWQIEIGNTLALKGDLEDAIVHMQVATMMNPDSWVAWSSLASFCITHNYEISPTGIEAARKALLLVPDSPVLLDIMGSAYMAVGDLDSAERFFLQALTGAPNQAEIQFHLGQLYLQEQKKELAFSYLRGAAENATSTRIRDNANLLLQQNGGG
jgi:tetratricopeptide (TPR) repeat protein